MTIDKSWSRLANRNCPEFFTGLDAFLEMCKDHLNISNTCRCPCEWCDNNVFAPLATLRVHIHRHGFSSSYTTWRFHGEQFILPAAHDDLCQTTDELHDFLDDVRQENTANEHDTDTDEQTEDPGNTSDELGELYKLAATELYPGCEMSSFDFLAKLMHMKVINKWTDTSFDQLLELLRVAFPTAKIPSSHYDARKVMRTVDVVAENHRRMVEEQNAQVGSEHPLTEREIMVSVLGERRGNVRGLGRKVTTSSSSASGSGAQSQPTTCLYSQTEVDAMYEDRMASQHTQLQEELRAQQMQTQALYEALRRAGISVDLPSVSQSPPDTHLARGDQ